jgi:redox-sensitive bicupin YhaK (pirin superfamily)
LNRYTLTLSEHRLEPSASAELPATPRVLYVTAGDLTVGGATVETGAAWHGTGTCAMAAGPRGATTLSYELRPAGSAAPGGGRVLLDHPIALDPRERYLMRCDRVDFAPGGEALPHGHRGGGIRWLLAGALEVRVGGAAGRLMRPGDAWFETGVEPVHALASREEPTTFIRVSILPREIQGRSSIVYVDHAHASVKPRRYTVYVDDPIELPDPR